MRRSLVSALCGASALIATPASSQILSKPLIAEACKPHSGIQNLQGELALAVLHNAGVLQNGETRPYLEAIRLVTDAMDTNKPTPEQVAVRDNVSQLQGDLGFTGPKPGDLGMRQTPRGPGREGNWLFTNSVVLTCVKRGDSPDEDPGSGHFQLRASVDDLSGIGKDRREAGAATIGYLRMRVTQDNGTIKTTATASLKGVVGYLFTGNDSRGLTLFSGYELKRVRTDPAPTLSPGKSQDDGDTDVIQLGVKGYLLPRFLGGRTLLEASGSAVFDQVRDSSRVRVNVAATPSLEGLSNPICAFGAFNGHDSSIVPGLRGRCGFTGVLQVSHFFDKGTATVGASDELVFGGGKFSFELVTDAKSGVIAGVNYQYLQRLHGTLPSIDRFSAYVKYRHWVGTDFGIDFSFDFSDGINPDTFADENKLQFNVGLIF